MIYSHVKLIMTMNRKRFSALIVLIAAVVAAFVIIMNTKKEDSKVNIGKSNIRIEDGRLTPEALWAMGRIGGVTVSPDGTRIAYQHLCDG